MTNLNQTIKRLEIAQDIVRRADTVTLLKAEEVQGIYRKALAGEYDDYEVAKPEATKRA